jgi:cell division protein FtsB
MESEEGMERLTTEQIADIKEYFSRSKEVKTSSLAMKLSHDGLKLIDTIEALQQENEQLRAQVAELRDSLKWLKSISFSHEDDLEQWPSQETREPIEHALSNSMGVDYHNPADVEALRKAREALKQGINQLEKYINRFEQTLEEDACIEMHEAVVEIDKAIGGKEDV